MADERRTEKPKTPHKEAPHPLEWVIGALSGIMVAALVAYLGYRAISTDRRPPVFDLAVEEIESVGGAFISPFPPPITGTRRRPIWS